MTEVSRSLTSLSLPDTLQLLDYQLLLRSDNAPPQLVVEYLGDRDLQSDAQSILTDQIRRSLQMGEARVQYRRLSPQQGIISLTIPDNPEQTNQNSLELSPQDQDKLAKVGQILQIYPNLHLRLTIQRPNDSNPATLFEQTEALRDYWVKNWQISETRIQETTNVGTPTQVSLDLFLGEPIPGAENSPTPELSP
jgi:hypothetical protein